MGRPLLMSLRYKTDKPPDEIDGEPIDSLYLVPTKSAGKGVYKIFFQASDRHWALVRLARRYRWLLEV